MTCATGKVTDIDLISSGTGLDSQASMGGDGANSNAVEFYCMIFQYNLTTHDEKESVTMEYTNYTCDADLICKGKEMYSSIQVCCPLV